jgi:hypothetical protein
VGRNLDGLAGKAGFGHSYVVSNAKNIGDPKATIHSWGKLANGNMGSVNDRSKAADISKRTAQTDAENWKSLNADTNKNIAKIDAPDKIVDSVASAVKENTPYSILPGTNATHGTGDSQVSSPETNSNSAAFAVTNQAQAASGSKENAIDPNSFSLSLPGAGAAGKVQFSCTAGLRLANCQ